MSIESLLQSIATTLQWIAAIVGLGGLLLLIMMQLNNSKLGKILNNLRVSNQLLKTIAESRGAQAPPTLEKKADPPPREATAGKEPEVYKL